MMDSDKTTGTGICQVHRQETTPLTQALGNTNVAQ